MGRIPPIRRILPESFKDVPWMGRLANPINIFMEQTIAILTKGLTFGDNFDGQVINIVAEGQYPLLVKWDRALRPSAVWIGNVARLDGSDNAFTNALFLNWRFNENRQIEILDIIGLDDTNILKYNVTIIGVTG